MHDIDTISRKVALLGGKCVIEDGMILYTTGADRATLLIDKTVSDIPYSILRSELFSGEVRIEANGRLYNLESRLYANKDRKVTSIELVGFNGRKINLQNMETLQKITFIDCNFSNITDLNKAFHRCNSLQELILEDINFNSLTSMNEAFSNCYRLHKIVLNNIYAPNLVQMVCSFKDCPHLEEIEITNFKAPKLRSIESIFENDRSLKQLNLEDLQAGRILNIARLVYDCTSLKNININTKSFSRLEEATQAFHLCTSLKRLNLSKWKLPTRHYLMFDKCKSLEEVNLSSMKLEVEDRNHSIFVGCNSLKKVTALGKEITYPELKQYTYIY